MKRTTSVILAAMLLLLAQRLGPMEKRFGLRTAPPATVKTAAETPRWEKARCEGLQQSQSFSDAEAANVIKNGKGKMKAYKQLSDADVKALVAYVRSLKK